MTSILITGVDGSGKSTLIDKLKNSTNSASVDFVRVPFIDTSEIGNEELKSVATCINHLGNLADEHKSTGLKAAQLFSSMLIFHLLIEEKINNGKQLLFCERHPLIDTVVYAKFYAGKSRRKEKNSDLINEIEKKYQKELSFIINLLPQNYQNSLSDLNSQRSYNLSILTNFIYTWFFKEQKISLPELKSLFKVPLPNHIYYLKADPQLMFERIKSRVRLEAHESVETFELLSKTYDELFAQLKPFIDKNFYVVNANSNANLNQSFHAISQQWLK